MDASQWSQGNGIECSRNPEKKPRAQKEQLALNCPRCKSTNTKFCYYNNYSLSQPRYFCKSCRRYWTEGGSLRNVPVGGSSRKNKRSNSSSIPTQKTAPDLSYPPKLSPAPQNPKIRDGHPPPYGGISELVARLHYQNPNPLISAPVHNSDSPGFPMHDDLKPSPAFSVQNRFGNLDPTTMVFPFEESSYEFEQQRDRGMQRDSNGFWAGMLSGGSW